MFSEKKYKKRLHRDRPFVLLGNELDGRVFCDKVIEFQNFADLKERLPKLLKNIRGEGEWRFELYQVPTDYKIWHRHGYYRYPNRGTKLFTYSYMGPKIRELVFNDDEIVFVTGNCIEMGSFDDELEIELIRVEYSWAS